MNQPHFLIMASKCAHLLVMPDTLEILTALQASSATFLEHTNLFLHSNRVDAQREFDSVAIIPSINQPFQ